RPSKRARRQTNTPPAAAKSARQTLPACHLKVSHFRGWLHCSGGRPFSAGLLFASRLSLRPRLRLRRSRRQSCPPSSRLRAPASASSHSSGLSHSYARWWLAPRADPHAASLRFLRTGPRASSPASLRRPVSAVNAHGFLDTLPARWYGSVFASRNAEVS